jgi:hypothetical protein
MRIWHEDLDDAGKKYYCKARIYQGTAQEAMVARYANFKFGIADLPSLIADPGPLRLPRCCHGP